jgi:hypothetical protein
MSQAQSTKVITDQDAARAQTKAVAVSDMFHKNQLHANTSTIQHIQKVAESMLQMEMEDANKYVSIRIDAKTWWVLLGVPRKLGKSPIPSFERIRIVTIESDGSFHCSCGYQDCYGIPDRHVSHVAIHYGTNFECWTHKDVDLRYHNTYGMMVATKIPDAMNNEEKSIRNDLINARHQDFSIPLAPSICEYDSCMKYAVGDMCNKDEFSSYEMVAACIHDVKKRMMGVLNYSESEVSCALMAFNDGMNNAAGFTQESHNCDNNSFCDNGSGNDDDDNDDNSPIKFSWDASATTECKASSSAYAEAAPLWKELLQELDQASPSTRNFGIGNLKESIIELKSRNARRALSFGNGGVQGNIISSKVKSSKSTKNKHKKQDYYPSRG